MKTIAKSFLLLFVPFLAAHTAGAQSLRKYSHGNPSPYEQYMLELINRARANPEAEGRRLASSTDQGVKTGIDYFDVDTARLIGDFRGYPARPPLAMNARLLSQARAHSTDMARNNFQSHTGSNGSTIGERISKAGFSAQVMNESIYSNLVSTPYFAHAGFNIDWGSGSGGVQPGVGHRKNIMNFDHTVFREVGIGVVSRSAAAAAKYGKLAVTQDFGLSVNSPVFLLGVAYFDTNGNSICDPGEGLPGVRVTASVGSYFAVTSASGGYAIPFASSPGKGRLTFDQGGLDRPEIREFSMARENAKVDLRVTSGGPFVHLGVVDSVTSERGSKYGGSATFRITRVGPRNSALKVRISRPMSGGTGKATPKDYRMVAILPARTSKVSISSPVFEVTVPSVKSYADVKITAVKDSVNEPTEKAVFTLANLPNYRTATPASVSISIKK